MVSRLLVVARSIVVIVLTLLELIWIGQLHVGTFGSSGWFAKHGLGADVSVPDSVANRLKGIAVDRMRASGRLGPKGAEDITGDKWMRPRLVGGNC